MVTIWATRPIDATPGEDNDLSGLYTPAHPLLLSTQRVLDAGSGVTSKDLHDLLGKNRAFRIFNAVLKAPPRSHSGGHSHSQLNSAS